MRSLDNSEWTMTRIIACLCLSTLTLSFVVVVDNQTSSKHVRSSEHICRNKIQLAFSSLFIYGNRIIIIHAIIEYRLFLDYRRRVK